MTKSEKTAAAILAAAERLFLEKSYAEVSMDQIAQEGRVTKGALYHHFSSKEDLYLQMMHAALARMRELFGSALSSGAGCRERLARLTRAFLGLPKERTAVMRLVRRDVNVFAPPVRGRLVRAYQAALPALVEDAIREGIRDGEIARGDPRLLAWHFIATVEVVLGRYADAVFKDSEEKTEYVLDLFLRGAGRKAPAARRRAASRAGVAEGLFA